MSLLNVTNLGKSFGGNRMVTTVTEIADLDGAAVSTVTSTLLVRGEES